MDHSRSPRRYHNAGGQVSYYPPLSDEARFLQRLAEPELPPGTTDAERAAARADTAAEVEAAVDELGEEWAHAYQELRPDWQPPPTDIEISNQRAAELAAARAEQAAVTRFLQIIEDIRRDHTFYHDDDGASISLEPLYTHILASLRGMNPVTQAEAFAAELTAARAAIAAAVAELDAGVSEAHEAMDDPARDSSTPSSPPSSRLRTLR